MAVENCAVLNNERIRATRFPRASLSGLTAILAALVTLAAIASGGFSESALRLGSLVAWRFAFFVFFVALIAAPLCNLVPFGLCRALNGQRRQLIWSFSAAFGVFLLSVLVPNLVLPSSQFHEGLTGGMTLFIIFTGALAAILAYAATPHAAMRLGGKAQRAVLALAVAFFWLDYTLTALARISAPNRPDMFYGVSLSLMLAVVLLRLIDRLWFKGKGAAA